MRFAPGWAIMCTNIRALLTVGWHAVFVPKTNLAPDARQEDVRNMVGVSIITVAVKKGFPDVGNANNFPATEGCLENLGFARSHVSLKKMEQRNLCVA